ncbi:MAG: citrate transporter, partial [Lachnospiraceae bacterium]|nr:citrate transporter [Lachnospiraceae bacterium]
MKKILAFMKKELMLVVSLLAALISLFITPPSAALLKAIDWKTLATLFMLLSVLDGFKHENLFLPIIKLTGKIPSLCGLGFFLVFGVFFSSMFVTNDVSLIIFVPLTILL